MKKTLVVGNEPWFNNTVMNDITITSVLSNPKSVYISEEGNTNVVSSDNPNYLVSMGIDEDGNLHVVLSDGYEVVEEKILSLK